jgi:Uma2 family endonuclease
MAFSKIEMDRLVERSNANSALSAVSPEPLENGERMTRAEFERRYEAMPHLKKAELIEGVVHMPSPVRFRRHSRPHGRINTWIVLYAEATPGTSSGDNGTVRLDNINEPQPDVLLFIESSAGGAAHISEDDYLEGAPELIVEVAASSKFLDLYEKKEAYRRNGVKEYLVWSVNDGKLDWFRLVKGRYTSASPDARGVIRSRVFPGLWLNVPALLAGEMSKVFDTLNQGLQSKQHAAFVKRLAKKMKDR